MRLKLTLQLGVKLTVWNDSGIVAASINDTLPGSLMSGSVLTRAYITEDPCIHVCMVAYRLPTVQTKKIAGKKEYALSPWPNAATRSPTLHFAPSDLTATTSPAQSHSSVEFAAANQFKCFLGVGTQC